GARPRGEDDVADAHVLLQRPAGTHPDQGTHPVFADELRGIDRGRGLPHPRSLHGHPVAVPRSRVAIHPAHLVVAFGIFEEVLRDPPRPQRVAGKENDGCDRPWGSANVCTHDASIELIAQWKWTSPLCSCRSVARLAKTYVVVTMGTLRPMVTSLTESRTSFLSAIASESGEDQQLIERLFEHVATEDLAARDAAYLGGAAHSLANLSRARDHATEVRVLTPSSATHEWTSTHTVVQVCSDESPLLVDSIA